MLLLHGELLLLKSLPNLMAGAVLVGLVMYFGWRSIGKWNKRH